MGMKACSVETVGCQSIWTEMESAPVVMNTVHFCPRPPQQTLMQIAGGMGKKKGRRPERVKKKEDVKEIFPRKEGKK